MSKNMPSGPLLKPGGAPASIQSIMQDAIALHQRGQFEAAQSQYEAVLRKQPRNADALHLSGLIAIQLKDHQKASDLIGKAIKASPANAAYHVNYGIALKELGQFAAAVASYDRAIALQPGYAAAYYSRGNALMGMKKFDVALASFDKALALQPGDTLAQTSRGAALLALEQFDQAIVTFDLLIAVQPNNAEAHFNRAIALFKLGRLAEALDGYDRAATLTPNNADVHFNRAVCLEKTQRIGDAIASYDRAIALNPRYAQAHHNRGLLLRDQQNFDAAIASFENAVAIHPDYAEAAGALANTLERCNHLDAALAAYDRAIALQPDYVDLHWNRGLVLLLSGQFERGWESYEWRWKRDVKISDNLFFQEPRWNGKQSLEGRSIYLHHEQGFGDTLQFCRYAKLVADRGARVIMEVPQALIGVLKNLPGVSEWVVGGTARPAFDYQCPVLSLPMAFNSTIETIPCKDAYLKPEEHQVSHWKRVLGPRTGKRVGIVWSGNANHLNDHNRSISLQSFLDFIPPGIEVVSLQKEIRAADQEVLAAHPGVRHFGDQLRDFSDTAALCSLMDVVVSVDTSVAHLSAALGKPTWILLPFHPDWRWMLERNDSPWYTSVKLYRQVTRGDWAPAFAAVRKDLENLPATA